MPEELRETRVWLRIIQKKKLLKSLELLESALDECNQLISIFVASLKTAQKNLASK